MTGKNFDATQQQVKEKEDSMPCDSVEDNRAEAKVHDEDNNGNTFRTVASVENLSGATSFAAAAVGTMPSVSVNTQTASLRKRSLAAQGQASQQLILQQQQLYYHYQQQQQQPQQQQQHHQQQQQQQLMLVPVQFQPMQNFALQLLGLDPPQQATQMTVQSPATGATTAQQQRDAHGFYQPTTGLQDGKAGTRMCTASSINGQCVLNATSTATSSAPPGSFIYQRPVCPQHHVAMAFPVHRGLFDARPAGVGVPYSYRAEAQHPAAEVTPVQTLTHQMGNIYQQQAAEYTFKAPMPMPAPPGDEAGQLDAKMPFRVDGGTNASFALGIDLDHNWLSEYHCFVRHELLEVFQATERDVQERKSSKTVVLGQVGIRCQFCAHVGHTYRATRSSAFPSHVRQIYQSFSMIVRDHFVSCRYIPKNVKSKFIELKERTNTGDTISKEYWNFAAGELGLGDTDNGIVLGGKANIYALPVFSRIGGEDVHNGPGTAPVTFVTLEDRNLISEFLYLLLSQVQRIYLLPSERKGRRVNLRLGMPGLGCKHCCSRGRYGLCRIFPDSETKLLSKLIDLLDHLRRCTVCPKQTKQLLLDHLKAEHYQRQNKQIFTSMTDKEKDFLRRVWARLNSDEESISCKFYSPNASPFAPNEAVGTNTTDKNITSKSVSLDPKRNTDVVGSTSAVGDTVVVVPVETRRECVSLMADEDFNWLSEFHCFVRLELIEVFLATNADIEERKSSKKIKLHQVGIRCSYCATLDQAYRVSRASAYPSHIHQLYQSFSMMVRDHFGRCPYLPKRVKAKFLKLHSRTSSGDTISKEYWKFSAFKIGMQDTKSGITITEESKAAGNDMPPFGRSAEYASEIEPPVMLALDEDRPLVSDFWYTLTSQAQRIHLLPSERTGCRRSIRLGMPGFGCRHCCSIGRLGLCRAFPASKDKISFKLMDLLDHLKRCALCPTEVKTLLLNHISIKEDNADVDKIKKQILMLITDKEKEFFGRIWERLGHVRKTIKYNPPSKKKQKATPKTSNESTTETPEKKK